MRWLLFGALVITCFLWFNHSYERNVTLGYDFSVFYNASNGISDWGWKYNHYMKDVFKPIMSFDYKTSFTIWYILNSLSLIYVTIRASKVHWLLVPICVYAGLLALEVGQITPIMAVLCLFPLGAVLCVFVKPYVILIVGVHLWRYVAYGLRGDILKKS